MIQSYLIRRSAWSSQWRSRFLQFILGASRPAGFLAAGFRRDGAGRFVDDGFDGALAAGFLAAGFFAAGFRCDGGAFRFFVEEAGAGAGAGAAGRRGGSFGGGGGGDLAVRRVSAVRA